jgi:hypothetical protein
MFLHPDEPHHALETNPSAAPETPASALPGRRLLPLPPHVGGAVGNEAVDAKRVGGRAAFKKNGTWTLGTPRGTLEALQARWRSDPLFRQVLETTLDEGVTLVCFERGDPTKAYWGGQVVNGHVRGRNRLGEMLMELRKQKSEPAAASPAPAVPAAPALPAAK